MEADISQPKNDKERCFLVQERVNDNENGSEPKAISKAMYQVKCTQSGIAWEKDSKIGPQRRGNRHETAWDSDQMTLDFGLSAFKECTECGMPYNFTRAEDRKLHAEFHSQFVGGAVPRNSSKRPNMISFLEVVNGVEHRILSLDCRGPQDMRLHFEGALQASYDDLDGPHIESSTLWSEIQDPRNPKPGSLVPRYKIFAYYVANSLAGVVLAENIAEAGYFYHGDPEFTRGGKHVFEWDYDCEEMGIAKRNDEQKYVWKGKGEDEPSKIPEVLMCVDRIWVHAEHRLRGIATKLVDAARENFKPNLTIPKQNICYSWPTTMGIEFAEHYDKDRSSFLVEYSRAPVVVENEKLVNRAERNWNSHDRGTSPFLAV